ncbi:unnamed protein product [Phaeothamnion confervicola]
MKEPTLWTAYCCVSVELFLVSFLSLLLAPLEANGGCALHNWCNGHGSCDTGTSTCTCYEGWGADTDVTLYRAPDCSSRVCPSGKAWGGLPTSETEAHVEAECSNAGICDQITGECTCFSGFVGASCGRSECPNSCSGHGRCASMKTMATMSDALPLSDVTTYSGEEDGATWDEDMVYGCVCDSSWDVGLGSGETQAPEWFGPDCSLRHCPSGDDPNTYEDETDCFNVTGIFVHSSFAGETGNLCHNDCSGRGVCDYRVGLCKCFDGYYGNNCNLRSALAVTKK